MNVMPQCLAGQGQYIQPRCQDVLSLKCLLVCWIVRMLSANSPILLVSFLCDMLGQWLSFFTCQATFIQIKQKHYVKRIETIYTFCYQWLWINSWILGNWIFFNWFLNITEKHKVDLYNLLLVLSRVTIKN